MNQTEENIPDPKLFGDMTPEEKQEIREALPRGLVEVSCPWWRKGHWESKSYGVLFDEAAYRICEKKPN